MVDLRQRTLFLGAQPNDVFLLYFAGHSFQMPRSSRFPRFGSGPIRALTRLLRWASSVGILGTIATVAIPHAAAGNTYPYVEKGVRGVVVDASTSRPIAGVHIMATWVHHKPMFLHGTSHDCVQVSTAVTGEDGRFALQGPVDTVVDNPLGLTGDFRIHKAGWDELPRAQWSTEKVPSGLEGKHSKNVRAVETELRIPLRPVMSSRAVRLQYLLKLTTLPTYCSERAASNPGVRNFLNAAAADAKAVATAGWEQAAARVMSRRAARPEALDFKDWQAEWAILGSTKYAPSDAELEKDESHAMFLKAVHDADADKVRAAIAQGADVNRVGWRERTVLTVALDQYYLADEEAPAEAKRRWDIVRILLSAPGMDPDRAGARQHTPLMLALTHERLEAVEALLAAGANPNLIVGESPVMFAVTQHATRNPENASRIERIFRLVISHPRTDLNAIGRGHQRPLCSALASQQPDTIQALLDAGADPNVTCWTGTPALMYIVSMPPAMIRPGFLTAVSVLARSSRLKPETRDAAIRFASVGYGRNPELREALEAAGKTGL